MTVPSSSAYAKVNGLEMYFETHGTAPEGSRPLVLLHGGALTVGLTFSAVLPALAADRRIIAPELQGHGHTADIDRAVTVPDLASDVVALLDELGVGQADFLGFSLGGLTALELAVRHPERVGRLALAATMYSQDGVHDDVRVPDYSSPRLPSQDDFRQMADAYAAIAPRPEHFEDFLAKVSAAAHASLPWTADDLRALRAPTLLLVGDSDFVRAEHAAEMQRLIPDARLAVLPATTHMTLMHRTSLMLPLLGEFFT
ncbi:alpha/beta fold hydrolase [Streptomyces sp. SAI-041]|uniref:alpha/beta fold hydrolase n=1 Tax=Streptomyces sp. SAI-041 TaxID=2940548 RepID=UPI0024741BC3|nr:alpha/beta fold hydrolase [Streptomyces sp. SAI-041]MDH6553514.1 pimeloyl-ACP methyl ester carboxylesterase [Streptomyces sp. SAI-041]